MLNPFSPFDHEPVKKAKPLQAFFGETTAVHTMESLLGRGKMTTLIGDGKEDPLNGEPGMKSLFGNGIKKKQKKDINSGLFGFHKKRKQKPLLAIGNLMPRTIIPPISGKKAPGGRPVRGLFKGFKKSKKQVLFPKMKPVIPRLNMPQKRYLKKTRGVNTSRFGDWDGDRVVNGMDCFPFDKKRHTVPLNKAKYITVYHGTSKERAKKILKEGLIPQEFENKGKISFVSPIKSAAIIHAESSPFRYEGPERKPAIVRMKIPEKKIKESGYGYEELKTKPVSYSSEFRLREKVDPEDIKEVDVQKLKRKAMRQAFKPQNVGHHYNVEQRGEIEKSPHDIRIEKEQSEKGMRNIFSHEDGDDDN